MKQSVYLFPFSLLLILLLVGHVSAQNPKMDSLKKVIATTKSDTTKANTLLRLAVECFYIGNKDQYLKLTDDALTIALDHQYPFGIAKAYLYKGKYARYIENYYQALDFLNKGLSYADNLHEYKLKFDLFVELAETHVERKKDSEALPFFQKALKTASQNNDKALMANVLIKISHIHRSSGNIKKAVDYQKQALAIRRTVPDSDIIEPLFNLADMYRNDYKQRTTALRLLEEALTYAEKIKNWGGVCQLYLGIGAVYADSGLINQAKTYTETCIHYAQIAKRPDVILKANVNLSDYYFTMGQYRQSRDLAWQAYEQVRKTDNLYLKQYLTANIARTDSALGNFQSAYELTKLHVLYKDSLINSTNRQEIGRLEAQYDFDKQNEARQKAEAQAQARRMQLYSLFGGIFALVLVMTGFTYYRYRSKAKTNRVLNEKNEQITTQNQQILVQKAELENAYEELNTTLEQIQAQKQDIEQKNHKIEDSIRYAYQIQTAILPDPAFLQTALPPHFIFYQPKDIVSGDFYWASLRENRLFFCVADCTGHGVPGAFMSVVGANALHHTINELGLNDPDVILYELDRKIKATLRQEKTSESKDGMDIVLCVLEGNTLHYAGAGRPLHLLQNGNLIETKGDKFPIGGGQFEDKSFTAHTFTLQKGDRLYLFSDGITDQFGGANKKKFTPKRLQEFILNHQSLTIQEQGNLFSEVIYQWMKGQNQLDDLTLMGIEIA
jgi:serine phosphatase RsbU (regulator of sigma subunit)/tetratricopeptide (TPR) repeat protein